MSTKIQEDFSRTTFEGNVIRWVSNGNVPPKDIVEGFFESGLITAVQKEHSDATRSRETMQFLERYKEAMANRTEEQKAAERAEVRAAFGNDATVVNIITGEVV